MREIERAAELSKLVGDLKTHSFNLQMRIYTAETACKDLRDANELLIDYIGSLTGKSRDEVRKGCSDWLKGGKQLPTIIPTSIDR